MSDTTDTTADDTTPAAPAADTPAPIEEPAAPTTPDTPVELDTPDGTPPAGEVMWSFWSDNGGQRTVPAATVCAVTPSREVKHPKTKEVQPTATVYVRRSTTGKVVPAQAWGDAEALRGELAALGFEVGADRPSQPEPAPKQPKAKATKPKGEGDTTPDADRKPSLGTEEAVAMFLAIHAEHPELSKWQVLTKMREQGHRVANRRVAQALGDRWNEIVPNRPARTPRAGAVRVTREQVTDAIRAAYLQRGKAADADAYVTAAVEALYAPPADTDGEQEEAAAA